MEHQYRVGQEAELSAGTVTGVGPYAVANVDGEFFAVSRRCRHVGVDLAGGKIDEDGCLVCPWHQPTYDLSIGRMGARAAEDLRSYARHGDRVPSITYSGLLLATGPGAYPRSKVPT
jgi:nitrite reductase/ring-hydroxylating ferredoxin subunit